MNKDQKLLEEAYQSMYESSEVHPEITKYIERGCKGDLDLFNMPTVRSLPEELKIVRGNLEIYKTKIQSLPEDLEVQGNLDISYTNIASLPKGLKVGGNLYATACGNLETIPKDLQVKGSLNLSYTNITSLPEGLQVGTLQLVGSKITSLPKNLKLRFLDLQGTPIASLPEGLEVDGMLNLKGSNITKVSQLPLDLKGNFTIDAWGFNEIDFWKNVNLSKQLSKDFDVSVLNDFS